MGDCPTTFESLVSQGKVLRNGPGQREWGWREYVFVIERSVKWVHGMVKIRMQRSPKAVF